jgi:hypothetical protein
MLELFNLVDADKKGTIETNEFIAMLEVGDSRPHNPSYGREEQRVGAGHQPEATDGYRESLALPRYIAPPPPFDQHTRAAPPYHNRPVIEGYVSAAVRSTSTNHIGRTHHIDRTRSTRSTRSASAPRTVSREVARQSGSRNYSSRNSPEKLRFNNSTRDLETATLLRQVRAKLRAASYGFEPDQVHP